MSTVDKQTQNDILNDVQSDCATLQQKVQEIKGYTWGDEVEVSNKDIQDLLYRVKVIEQRLKYLGGYHY